MGDIWLRTLVKMGLDPEDAKAKLTIFRGQLKQHLEEERQDGGADTLLNVQGNKLIESIGTNEGAAAFLATLPKFVYILKTVESTPGVGILIAVMLDAMLTAFSTGGEMFQNLMVLIPGFGPAIVAVFGMFFWPPLAMIAFSRADFSEASEIYLKAIPFGVGKTLSTAFAKTDKFATKFADRFGEIKEQSKIAFGRLKETLNETKAGIEAKNPNLIKSLRDKADKGTTRVLNALELKKQEAEDRFNASDIGTAFKADRELAKNAIPTPPKAPYVPGSFDSARKSFAPMPVRKGGPPRPVASLSASDAYNARLDAVDAARAAEDAAEKTRIANLPYFPNLPYDNLTTEQLRKIVSQRAEDVMTADMHYSPNMTVDVEKGMIANAQIKIDKAKEELKKRGEKLGARRKQLSTKKRSKKNKTWRRTKRTKSARR